MALLTKVNYFGNMISAAGWECASTSENRSMGVVAEAPGPDGFIVAVESEGEQLAPQCEYIATNTASLTSIILGSTNTISVGGTAKTFMLGGINIQTNAGSFPTMTVTGRQVEDGGTGHCKCTLAGILLDGLAHAQGFGCISVSNGQLNSSTLAIETVVATAEVDGKVKASDLTGGKVTLSFDVIGVNDSGVIAVPTVDILTPGGNIGTGVWTTPLTQSNPNGDFPRYSGTIEFPLEKDSN